MDLEDILCFNWESLTDADFFAISPLLDDFVDLSVLDLDDLLDDLIELQVFSSLLSEDGVNSTTVSFDDK
jgi:hypothetical protein